MKTKHVIFTLLLLFFLHGFSQTTVTWELADEPNGISQQGFKDVINKARNHFKTNPNDTVVVKIAEGTHNLSGGINFGNGASGDQNGRLIFQGAGMDKTKLVFPVQGGDQMFAREIYRTEFKDMHFTRDQNTICQGTVVDIAPGYFIVDIHEGFLAPTVIYDAAPGGMYLEKYTPSKTNPRVADPVRVRLKWGQPGARPELIDKEKNRWKVYLTDTRKDLRKEPFNYKPGHYINLKGKWDGNSFRFLKGNDVVFENFKWTQTTRALVIVDNFKSIGCRMEIDAPINGQKPVLASNSGGFQIGGDNALIQDFYAEGVGDDNVALYTTNNSKIINAVFKTSPGRLLVDGNKSMNTCFENVIIDNIDIVIYYNTGLNVELYDLKFALNQADSIQPGLLIDGCSLPVTSAKFGYPETNYCINSDDPTPVIEGIAGGIFTSYPEGLVMDKQTGKIDLSESEPRDYVVTYTAPGSPSYHWNQAIVIDLDNASFKYLEETYCINDTSFPKPQIIGKEGGTFLSESEDLIIDKSTGAVDIAASKVGTYTISYTTPLTDDPAEYTRNNSKSCINTATTSFTISESGLEDDATFAYPSNEYCINDTNPIPIVTGTAGGVFTSPSEELVIDKKTGEINIKESPVGNYTVQYTTPNICKTISDVNIKITQIDTTTKLDGATITANEVGASYQWLDCENNQAIIPKATDKEYTATKNGSYAVAISKNGCTELSECIEINTLNSISNSFTDSFTIYPNPTNGKFTIEFKANQRKISTKLYTTTGQLIKEQVFENTSLIEMAIHQANGNYLLEIKDDTNKKAVIKLVKK